MRPVDLARAAGVSTQQVRNLEAAGALPAAARSVSGYRSYDERHLAALLAYRALTPGLGAGGARAVLAAVGDGDVAAALEVLDAGHAAVHTGRRGLAEVRATLTALTGAGERKQRADEGKQRADGGGHRASAAAADRPLRVGELARLLGVRTSALRVWESAGLLTPSREHGTGYRLYSPADVRDARVILTLRQSHYLFDRIRPIVDGLRRAGSAAELLAALDERRAALAAQSLALVAGAARLWEYLELAGEPVSSAASAGN